MAKAIVKMICEVCGKTYTMERTFSSRKEADNFEDYMDGRAGTCHECYAEKMKSKREADKAKASAEATAAIEGCALALPELVGSEKQIQWATDIRKRFIAQMYKRGVRTVNAWEKLIPENQPEEKREVAKAEYNKIMNASAKFWIEIRGQKIYGLTVEG